MDNINLVNNFLEPLLKKCGEISLNHGSKLNISKKGDKEGFVSNIDIEISNYVFKSISTKFPLDSIISEDGPQDKLRSNRFVWYVDPLDGTTNYIHNYPSYAISICRYDKKKSVFMASGIYIPYYDQLFIAYGDKEATLNGEKIKVSDCSQLKEALILTGMSFGVSKDSKELKKFIKLSTISSGTRRSGSAAVDLCYIAAGFADGYYHFNLKSWDIAAGCHLVRNAGGEISNIAKGKFLNLIEGTVIASNGLIHNDLKSELLV